jgi:DNA-binding MarR family transcriptional regulator
LKLHSLLCKWFLNGIGFSKTQSAGYLANHMARLFATGLQRRIQLLGLATAQFMVLLELWAQDGLTQRDLVQRVDVEQATMANTLRRMERDGLIERRPCEGDKRARIVCLTDRARGLQGAAILAAQAQNRAALAGLTVQEQDQLVDLMTQVIATMQRG